MPLERELWLGNYSREAIPPFLCPHCKQGRLNADEKSLVVEEPAWSKELHGHEAWEPEWIEERFVLFLRCGVAKCSEVVAVSGDYGCRQHRRPS